MAEPFISKVGMAVNMVMCDEVFLGISHVKDEDNI
jgi:hypothetical protein